MTIMFVVTVAAETGRRTTEFETLPGAINCLHTLGVDGNPDEIRRAVANGDTWRYATKTITVSVRMT